MVLFFYIKFLAYIIFDFYNNVTIAYKNSYREN